MGYLDYMGKIKESVLDFMYPGRLYCICCGNIINETRSYGLCDHCITHIRWEMEERELPLEGYETKLKLLKCTDYGIYERSIVFALKYDGHKYIAKEIAGIMKDRLTAGGYFEDVDTDNLLIVPVPLHESRFSERGFNQAELIGRNLSNVLNAPILDILERNRKTLPMKNLGPKERSRNIAGAISPKYPGEEMAGLVEGRDLLLVDDFYTTGSTAGECAKALIEFKPRSITAIVFASGKWIE